MPIKVGLDTSFVIGLLDERDLWRAPALKLQPVFQSGDYQLHIFDCV